MLKRGSVGVLVVGLLGAAIFAVAALASAPKLHVLKHPRREHCKTHYIKKTRIVKVHGHTVKQTVCQYVVPKATPKSTTPTQTTPTPEPKKEEAPAPFTTTTTLTITSTECKDFKKVVESESCIYYIAYSTVNSKGEVPPGEGPIIKEHVPPSQEERKISIPSGAEVYVGWDIYHGECSISMSINKMGGLPSYACEKQDPRVVLVAEYANPAAGWLASKSEPITLE